MSEIKYPLRFAHRGLVQYAPENTLGAFEAAVEHGCEGIEIDIHLSKDGEPIVVHDSSLGRLTDGEVSAFVNQLTVDELKSTNFPYAAHLLPHNPPVPYSEDAGSVAHYKFEEINKMRAEDKRIAHPMTFEEFDKWFDTVERDVTIEIEFCDLGLMKRMHEILSKSNNCHRYILFSGNKDTNNEIQSYMRENGKPEGLRLGANIRRLTKEAIEFIDTADLYEVGLNDKWFTAEDVKFLADRGIKVFSNLGDYPEWWEEMEKLGVTAFKTNYAEAYLEWFESKNKE